MHTKITTFFRLTLFLLFVFLLHRSLSFYLLTSTNDASWLEVLDVFAIGALSDFWVSVLAGLCVFLLALVNIPAAAIVGAFMALTCFLHQGYVEFFHYPIIPSHLSYLIDKDFIVANGSSGFSWAGACIACLAGIAAWGLKREKLSAKISPKTLWISFASTLVLATLLHSANIHYRVQHMVPEAMQVNLFERLYIHAHMTAFPPPVSGEDLKRLTALYASNASQQAHDTKTLAKALFLSSPPSPAMPVSPLGQKIKSTFEKQMLQQKKPIILTVLLESARPSEVSSTLTPAFEALKQTSIVFSQAFSTGSVTRGAQEAVLCGFPASQYTSMMRERPDLNFSCLSDRSSLNAETFWYHGGKAAFDAQVNFWKKHQIKNLLSFENFADSAPQTSWGVSDRALFLRTVEELVGLRQKTIHRLLLGMVLTVTNHVPWRLPSDAKNIELPSRKSNNIHRSFQTTAYTDFALGEFIQGLKQKNLWQNMLLFIVSDHGIASKPYQDIYPAKENLKDKLLSHIVLAVSGGIAETALSASSGSKEISSMVSQVDIAHFIAYLLNRPEPMFGENLFTSKRQSPVFSELSDGVFFPQLDKKISRPMLVGDEDLNSVDEKTRTAVLYFRSYLNFLNQPSH